MAGQQPAFFKPTVAEVVAAARSLYEDELKPFGRILLKRIRERAAAAAGHCDVDAVPLIDPKYLRKVCESCQAFALEAAEGREYAVVLLGQPCAFVDATSTIDPYPGLLWTRAAAYFEALEGEAARLPCGRYACAQVLVARELPFLRGKSLGEVCHIVQLAISQKKILGYADGHTVPYSLSEECAKQRCAVRQQPSGEAPADQAYATWEDLRVGLRLILEGSCNPAPGTITLSNVKRLFRSQLDLEVSETVLGHSRVCDLLQDARLQDVCRVEVLGSGQALVRLVEAVPSCSQAMALCLGATPSTGSSCASTRQAANCFFGLATVPAASPLGAAASSPLIFPPWACVMQQWPGSEQPCGVHRADSWEGSTTASSPASGGASDACTSSSGSSAPSVCGEWETCSNGPATDGELPGADLELPREAGDVGAPLPPAFAGAGFVVRNTFIDEAAPVAAAVARRRSRSVPRDFRPAAALHP